MRNGPLRRQGFPAVIRFEVKADSPGRLKSYLDGMRDKVIASIRAGMLSAMQKLAAATVSKMGEAGIQPRTGLTATSILKSPKVSAVNSGDAIRGTVSAWNGHKPIGLWLGGGTNVPAVVSKKVMAFIAPDGTLVFTRKHKAFTTRARPFLNEALSDSREMITETIRQHVNRSLSI